MQKQSISVALLLAVLLAGSTSQAQPQELVDKFEKRSHTSDSLTIVYRLFVPEDYDPSLEYPLVLTLHGDGERGIDNEKHIANHRIATSWADPINQSRWPAFVVSPQAIGARTWMTFPAPGDSTLPPIVGTTFTVMSLLDSLQNEFNIDLDRMYVTGLSSGGFGTFDVTARFLERFAAAIPMSGGFRREFVRSFDGLPFWIFHGEQDGTVSSFWSRNMVEAFLDEGRQVLFTNCGLISTQCAPISDDMFEAAVDAHVDVIYTGYPAGGHIIWEESYDDPRLAPWVFAQHRLIRDGIQIAEPVDYPAWAGTESIEWNVSEPGETGEMWYSNDNGETWAEIDSVVSNSGSLSFDTEMHNDTPFARTRLVFYDGDGFVHKREDSGPFVIDNPGNGAPFLRIDDRPFRGNPEIDDDEIDVMVLASDPELQTLDATVYYSADGGLTWGAVKILQLEPSGSPQTVDVDLSSLPNSNAAMLRVELNDGELSAVDQTSRFVKNTLRSSNTFVHQVAGNGVADVRLNWVDQGSLTGHRYRITFNDARPSATAYDVTDLTTGQKVLENTAVSDGVAESPAFDGIRLLVDVLDKAEVDLDSTGWTLGDSDLGVSISAPTVNTPDGIIVLLATPADYEITMFNDVVDTSAALMGFSEMPMRFTIEKRGAGRSEILFNDRNADGWPSPGDFFYILEPVASKSELTPAWFFRFEGDENTLLPAVDDQFLFKTIKPATDQDVFEFDAVVGLRSETEEIPESVELLTNYPNPFSATTTIEYRLPAPAEIELKVFDMLGRTVQLIEHGQRPEGSHTAIWSSGSDAGQIVSPGMYFYRLTATDLRTGEQSGAVRKMMVVR